MKKHILTGAVALIALASGAVLSAVAAEPAGDNAPAAMMMGGPPPAGEPQDGGVHHQWTLEEARQHAHERAEKLDKMTAPEWAEHEKRRHEFYEKWKKMTPEEKEAFRKERSKKREMKAATPAKTDKK